jgi:hypothetical protein
VRPCCHLVLRSGSSPSLKGGVSARLELFGHGPARTAFLRCYTTRVRRQVSALHGQGLSIFPCTEPPVTPAVLPAGMAVIPRPSFARPCHPTTVIPLARHGPSFARLPVIPGEAGIHYPCALDPGFRRGDDLRLAPG